MSCILIENVSFSYQASAPLALQDVNLEINEGEFVSFIGPSGCGKSTLLNLLAGLRLPTAGSISCLAEKINGPGLERGVVFQNYSLFPWMTAEQNVLLALEQVKKRASKQELRSQAHELLNMVDLAGVEKKYPSQLSGGMQQRVALARTFALDSPILLMDEPFGAVDAVVRSTLQDCLLELWDNPQKKGNEKQKTVIMVTHDIDEAIFLSDRIVVFAANPGRIVDDLAVSIPRPRSREELFQLPEYAQLKAHLFTMLQGKENSKSQEQKQFKQKVV